MNGDDFFSSHSDSTTEATDPNWGRVGLSQKTGCFMCQCGCGQSFFATYKTRYPRYANKTHKVRGERARARARIDALRHPLREGYTRDEWYQPLYEAYLDHHLSKNYGRG